jgi:hypothetical protein
LSDDFEKQLDVLDQEIAEEKDQEIKSLLIVKRNNFLHAHNARQSFLRASERFKRVNEKCKKLLIEN